MKQKYKYLSKKVKYDYSVSGAIQANNPHHEVTLKITGLSLQI
jgi:hypothetical protein